MGNVSNLHFHIGLLWVPQFLRPSHSLPHIHSAIIISSGLHSAIVYSRNCSRHRFRHSSELLSFLSVSIPPGFWFPTCPRGGGPPAYNPSFLSNGYYEDPLLCSIFWLPSVSSTDFSFLIATIPREQRKKILWLLLGDLKVCVVGWSLGILPD